MGRRVSGSLRMLVLGILVISILAADFPSSNAQLNSPTPKNVILFYDDYPSRKDPNFQVTKEIARPLVAHVDQNGNPTDLMFDSFIFYSMWLYYSKNPTQTYVDSWINYLFTGNQIANLDSTVADVKAALKQPDYKMNVFLTVPVASLIQPKRDLPATAIQKNVDKLLSKWAALNPKNLQLVGFYWGYTENLRTSTTELSSLVKEIATYVHSKGFKMLMIPYLDAYGYQKMHEIGIDYVTMQPNYAWDATSDLTDFSKVNGYLAAGYIDGTEFETPIQSSVLVGDWRTNLQTYFDQARSYNWQSNRIQTYYYHSPISQMGRTSGSDYQTAYETIYQYVLSARA